MKNSRPILLLAVAVFATTFLAAQQPNLCSTMQHLQRQMQNDPQLAQQYQEAKLQLRLQEMANANRDSRATNYATIYIPVVFHVVHNGDAVGSGENISDAQVMSQIDALNDQFNALDVNIGDVPLAFQSLVATTNFRFCLAKFDPSGNPTTGIIRHQLSNASWDSEDDIDDILKPSTIWNRSNYLNIWSVRMGGALVSNGVLAYASLPFFGSANKDGVVARYNTIGTTGSLIPSYRLGKTVTHEIGHWLGLLHVWGDDDGKCQGEPQAGTDYVGDTPDQADLNFGCPTFPHITCNNGPNGDMFMNYMDYSDDDCRNMFTHGQNTNMHSAVDNFRSGIKTSSTACFYNLDAAVLSITFPKDTICSFSFRPVITLKNEGITTLTSGKFYYQVDGDVVQIFNWNGSIPSQSTAQVLLPMQQVYIEDIHTFDVTFGNANGQPADNFSGNDSRTAIFYAKNGAAAGSAVPFLEGFEGTVPPTNWSIYNPNNDVILWQKSNSYGGYGTSQSSIYMDNTAYGTNPNKKKDAFITDAYDFQTITQPELKFDVAYAQYSAGRSDSLNVYYSLNCGSTWTKVWNQKGSDLATAPEQTTLFTPSASQWKTVSVPVFGLSGQNKVSFKFENVSSWGNAMYIDNINLQNNPAASINEIEKVEIAMFPNPANSLVAARLPVNHPFTSVSLMNSIGQVVKKEFITDSAVILSLDGLTNGLYFLHFEGDGSNQTEKLLIVK